MNEILTSVFQVIVMAAIAAAGIFIKTHIIPWITKKLEEKNITISQAEWDMAQTIIVTLVESAFRLKNSGKIEDAKAYVMELAKTQLSTIGITLSDEMIDEIRRAAVIEWEKSVELLKNNVIEDEEDIADKNEVKIGFISEKDV